LARRSAKAHGLCGLSLPRVIVGFHDAGFGIFAISDCSSLLADGLSSAFE